MKRREELEEILIANPPIKKFEDDDIEYVDNDKMLDQLESFIDKEVEAERERIRKLVEEAEKAGDQYGTLYELLKLSKRK